MDLDQELTSFCGASILHDERLQSFSLLESAMCQYIASSFDFCLVHQGFQDLNHTNCTPWVLALVTLEDLHTLIDQSLEY